MTINKGLKIPLPYFAVDSSLSKECVLRLTDYLDMLTRHAKANGDDVFLKSLSYWINRYPDETVEKYSFSLHVSDTWIDSVCVWSKCSRTIADSYIISSEYRKRFDNLVKQLMVIIEDES